MKKWIWGLALALALAAPAIDAGEKAKATAEPFYRKYLVPGNPLDDQILEQERRVEASPDDASLRNDFGNLLAKRRFPEQAAEQYELAAKLDKSSFISLYNLGLLRETEGKTGAAISAYKKSISRKPGFPPSRFRLGRLYERQGKADDAVREYAVAMRIDPSMREARRNPLVVDAELLYLASVQNYSRDLATTSMQSDQVYVEEARFRKVPVDRALTADEVAEKEGELEPEPQVIGPASAPGPGVTDSSKPPVRPRPAQGEVGGVPGGRARTPGARPPRMRRPTPRPPEAAAPAPAATPSPDEMQPEGDPSEPETVPEPTPTPPAEPEELEPS